jgi:general secretion pathway protein C
MNQLLDKRLLFFIKFIFIPIFIVKLLWSISLFYLDHHLIYEQSSNIKKFSTQSRLAKKILDSPDNKDSRPVVKSGKKITDFKLKATYVDKKSSFIIIEDRVKTEFIYIYESYQGYKLVEVYEDRAIFEKDSQNYGLYMSQDGQEYMKSNNYSLDSRPYSSKRSVPIEITKREISNYSKNPQKIWNNIRIEDFRVDSGINFRVSYVKNGSIFSKIGLKPGDIITRIEGQEVSSLGEVMEYYSKIEDLESLILSIKRGSQEMDLEFQIK